MKNKFGLLDADIETIVQTLSNYSKVEHAYIFGSRAKGNFKKGSDVDIALMGAELDFDTLIEISNVLNEETRMPYKFDVFDYNRITESALREHIERVGIEIYSMQKELL